MIVAHSIEHRHKCFIGLSIYLFQLYRHKSHIREGIGIEEEILFVIASQYILHVGCYHGLKLEYIAHKKQLLAAKRLSHIAAVHSQHAVHIVNHIAAHHRYLIYYYQVDILNQLHLVLRETQGFANGFRKIIGIVGQQWLQRHLKK